MKKTVLSLLLLSAGAAPLPAQETKEIRAKSQSLEKVKSEMQQKIQERERLQKEAEDLSRSIHENESKMKTVETSLIYTKQKNTQVEMQLASTKNHHDQLLRKKGEQKAQLKDAFKNYYVAALFQTPDAPDLLYARQALHAMSGSYRDTLSRTTETGGSLQTLVETQYVIRRELQKQEDKLTNIRTGTKDKERTLAKKKTQQDVLDSEVRELEQTAREMASLIDALRTKVKKEAEMEKAARRQKQLTGQSPIERNSLPWPAPGKVTTKFGRQQQPTTGTTFVSNGIEIVSEEPQAVTAVADGKVLYAGEFMSYGSMTVVEHAGDWYTVYGHLARWETQKGQQIKKGDRIGATRPKANGGYETYFELRFYGKSVDPLPWLQRN